MRFVDAALRAGLVLTLAAPATLHAQSAGGVRCNDGTYSRRSGVGACWFSGGVASVAKPVPAAPAPAAAPSKARPVTVERSRPAGKSANARNAKPNLDRDSKKVKKTKTKKQVSSSPAAGWTGAGSASSSSTTIKTRTRSTSITKHAPKSKPAPRGATARCMDGSYSYATHKRKACNKQGGVAGWLRADIPPE
jgi:hypothetical protein